VVGPEDSVLSIAGAGDQVFAMLEFAKKVVAVDSNTKQLIYLTKQVELIRARDYLTFLMRIPRHREG
jgi:hypothetical protein